MRLRIIGLMAGVLLAAGAATAQPRDLVPEGGTLIDGTGAAPIPDSVIVVEGTRIKAVGRRGQVAIPAGANVVNLTGRTVLPGLIDAHIHMQDWQLPMFLPFGVTTIVENNTDAAWIFALRDAVAKGKVKGPIARLWAAGSFVYGNDGPYVMYQNPGAKTVDEARADAKLNLAAKPEIMKVGGNTMSDAQLKAVIEVANANGLQAIGHSKNIMRAANVGFKFAEHTWTIANALLDPDEKTHAPDGSFRNVADGEAKMNPKDFPPLIKLMVSHGVFFNPTLYAEWQASTPRQQDRIKYMTQFLKDHPGQFDFVPAETRKAWTEPAKDSRGDKAARDLGYAHAAEFIKEYSAAGGKIIAATDTGTSVFSLPGLSMSYEMQMLVDAGVPPMKAIQGGTLWNAQMMKKDKDIGSVEVGKLGDFLVIEGNPLADIGVTKNVRMVIKDGVVVDTKLDPHWVNPIPEPYSATNTPPDRIVNVAPQAAMQGSPDVGLVVTGTNFTPNSVVRFNNSDLATRFVSSSELTANLDARLLKTASSYALYVLNPGLHKPGLGGSGTVSAPVFYPVNSKDGKVTGKLTGLDPKYLGATNTAVPQLLGLAPRMALQSGPAVTLTLKGQKFTPASMVRFDNVDLPTHFVNANQVTATLDAKLLQRPVGGYVVYVVTPGAHDAQSGAGTVSAPGYFLVNLKDGQVLNTGVER